MPTVEEVYRQNRPEFGAVPKASWDFVCSCCLGPVNEGYRHCYACGRLFGPLSRANRTTLNWLFLETPSSAGDQRIDYSGRLSQFCRIVASAFSQADYIASDLPMLLAWKETLTITEYDFRIVLDTYKSMHSAFVLDLPQDSLPENLESILEDLLVPIQSEDWNRADSCCATAVRYLKSGARPNSLSTTSIVRSKQLCNESPLLVCLPNLAYNGAATAARDGRVLSYVVEQDARLDGQDQSRDPRI